jgi:hypothetical protein
MDPSRFFLSTDFVRAVVLACFGLAALAAGLGYRRLARALAITFVATIPAGFGLGFAGALIGLRLAGRGEGAGVAALFFGIAVGVTAAAITLGGGIAFIFWKRHQYLGRGQVSKGFLAAGVALLLFSVTSSLLRIPAFRSDRSLARQLGSGFDVQSGGDARDQILARGRAAVPELLISLQKVESGGLHTFEDGRSQGAKAILEMLGELGGPDAITALRWWFNSDYAPDVRAMAANGLGRAGDVESAHAIALLLEERSYEWRKCHADLLFALGHLKATEELTLIRSALIFDPAEEGSSFQISLIGTGVQTLVIMDTPESWAIIREVAGGGSAARRDNVVRALESMGRTLEASDNAGGTLPGQPLR